MFKIGCDPEIIPVDNNGNPRSAIGKIGGEKKHPRPVLHGAVQEDNVNAEFNIEPCTNFEEWEQRITGVMSDLAAIMREHKLYISTLASAIFNREELTGKALIAGCDPDYDAWEISDNIPPYLGDNRLRSAGGHIHVSTPLFGGYRESDDNPFIPNVETENPMEGIFLVRTMDRFLGVPSVLMDKDTERKKLYGKAGCFRPKPFGVEYRTLSNFWIFDSELRRWAYNQTQKAVSQFTNPEWREKLDLEHPLGSAIVKCINTNNREMAQEIINE
jgi:hypothetical protein